MKKKAMMVVLTMVMVATAMGCGKEKEVLEDQNALFADAAADGRADELQELQDAVREDRPADGGMGADAISNMESTEGEQEEGFDYSWVADTSLIHYHSIDNYGVLIPLPNLMINDSMNSFEADFLPDYLSAGNRGGAKYASKEYSGNLGIIINQHACPNNGIEQHAHEVALEDMSDEQLIDLMDKSQDPYTQSNTDPSNYIIRKENDAIYVNQKVKSEVLDTTNFYLFSCAFIPSISDTEYARGTACIYIQVSAPSADTDAVAAAEQYIDAVISDMTVVDNVPVQE